MILKICLVVAVCTIIGLVAFQLIDPNLNSSSISIGSSSDGDGSYTISITGEVASPGEYVLSNNTMEELIAAAGGLTTNADDRCFNLDAELETSNSYYISPKYDYSDVCSEDPIEKVNINEADATELKTLDGFGDTISQNLIDYRDENGDFYILEDIMNVSGIGNSKFNLCKNYIILHD